MSHFVLHSSRVTEESELGRQWKRGIIEYESFADDEESIQQAVVKVEPGEHEDPTNPNESLLESTTDSSDENPLQSTPPKAAQ